MQLAKFLLYKTSEGGIRNAHKAAFNFMYF